MFNTPPTFAWYLWHSIQMAERAGQVAELDKRNQAKADLLYGTIDKSDFYRNDVALANRSRMNVPFQLAHESTDKLFWMSLWLLGFMRLKVIGSSVECVHRFTMRCLLKGESFNRLYDRFRKAPRLT